MKAKNIFTSFLNNEKSGGIALIACTIVSLIIANSSWGASYDNLWTSKIGELDVEHWINDGLMAIFFLLVGLELKREILKGQLSKLREAILPIFGAIGGMIVPVILYSAFNFGTITESGTGIPMATDIAFALGVLSLLGSKVPASLKIFLAALAVIDDLGAILVIAIFYSKGLLLTNLFIALGIFVLLLIFNRLKVRNLIVYLIGGIVMWHFMLHSGVHASITGVMLALVIPFSSVKKKSPSLILEKFLNKPVAFIILPVFALANTAITITGSIGSILTQNYSLGIASGLIIGKPLGIFLLSFLAIKIGICRLPNGMNLRNLFGVGILGGIGFTMSIFITLLAFNDAVIIEDAKLVILISSTIAGLLGVLFLKMALKTKSADKIPMS